MKKWILAAAVIFLGASATAGLAEPPATQPDKEIVLVPAKKIALELVFIPAGKFVMGSPATEAGHQKNELQHEVTISKPFYMGKFPVTQEQWAVIMHTDPSYWHGRPKNPVEAVSWNDCQEFVTKVNDKLHGQKLFLPTEAQWEYACRAGTTTQYYTGNGYNALKKAGWYNGNSEKQTAPVGFKAPNAFGLYDMHGGVWEACSDWYGDYPAGAVTDPTGPRTGTMRVLRGGSWDDGEMDCRAAMRFWRVPAERGECRGGLRVAMAAGGH